MQHLTPAPTERPKLTLITTPNVMALTCSYQQLALPGDLPPRKPPAIGGNRVRKHLHPDEVKALRTEAASFGRNRLRDLALVTVLYRHGIRNSQAADLRWSAINWASNTISIPRKKGHKLDDPSMHPIEADELALLKKLYAVRRSDFIFESEQAGKMSTRRIHEIVQRAGRLAGMAFDVYPHMLRHTRGTLLASKGMPTRNIQGYLQHADISSTIIYTCIAAEQYQGYGAD